MPDNDKPLESDANRAAREEAEARVSKDDAKIREDTNKAFAEPEFQPAAKTEEVKGARGAHIDETASSKPVAPTEQKFKK